MPLYPDPATSAAAQAVARAVERAFREDEGRAVSSLIRSFGDLTLAEESVQEAYIRALATWGAGVPDNPGGWILTTARNRAIDTLRRAGRLETKTAEMAVELDRRQQDTDTFGPVETIADDRLRLAFLCCHPALDAQAQIALTLRLVAGLSTVQIAAAFMVKTATMAARITRAKARIAAEGTPFRLPDDHELPDRLASVLHVLYLIFNQGYVSRDGAQLVDLDTAAEAIRLTSLVRRLMPEEPEVSGLLALMILTHARRDARQVGLRMLLLGEQDRRRWHTTEIEDGLAMLERALRRGRPGPYQLQAAIQAVHVEATTAEQTDWTQIVGLYGALEALDPSPVIRLNHAVAVGKADGGAAALARLDDLRGELDTYHLFHAALAEFSLDVGDVDTARAAFARALALTDNEVERRHLSNRLASLK
ncbi:RNA polymerase sigma factor [Euzebya tangerina]|uniref:RNA polymerase sigma factor n=1 Tax=Euzebya tangerina TaxID=591198 RepID=UPI000E3199BC|nr:sigma-70 family RNA polymerase sigma factor [Euzebya tangerina]